jgi:hypothetical protein
VNGEDFGFRLPDVKVPGLGEDLRASCRQWPCHRRRGGSDKFGEFVAQRCWMWSLPLTGGHVLGGTPLLMQNA